MRISCVFIVRNEEELLPIALESVKDADEIIVVDTGSTDRTKEIAAKYTDKIYDFPWRDDFAAARNEAIKHATGDWIYSIDADQKLLSPMNLVRSEAGKAEFLGHKVALVKTVTITNHVHWREVLFKRDPEVFWKGAVHEALSIRGTHRTLVERFRGSSPSKAMDPERNLRILEKQEKTQRTLFYLGRENFERARYQKTIQWMEQYLKKKSWDAERAETYLCLAYSYWRLEKGDKARDACMNAIRINPDFKEALLLMSEMHYSPRKEKWKRIAEQATNLDVLFIRNKK